MPFPDGPSWPQLCLPLLAGCAPRTGMREPPRRASRHPTPSPLRRAESRAFPHTMLPHRRRPTAARSPAEVHDVNWYLKRAPTFRPAAAPEPVTVPDGRVDALGGRGCPPHTRSPSSPSMTAAGTRTTEALEFIKRAKIPVTLFLNSPAAASYTSYFKAIKDTGASIENHTVTHRKLKGQIVRLPAQGDRDCADKLEQLFGQRPYCSGRRSATTTPSRSRPPATAACACPSSGPRRSTTASCATRRRRRS